MNFKKEIKAGFFTRYFIRKELVSAVNEIKSNDSFLKENSSIELSESWHPFYSVFTLTGTNLPEVPDEFIQEWIDDIMNIEID